MRLPDNIASHEQPGTYWYRQLRDYLLSITGQSSADIRAERTPGGIRYFLVNPPPQSASVSRPSFSGLIRFPENRKYTVPEEWDAFLLVHFDSYTAEWLPVEPAPCPPAAQVYPLEQLSGDLIIARL